MKKLIAFVLILTSIGIAQAAPTISIENGTEENFELAYDKNGKHFVRILTPKDVAVLGDKNQLKNVGLKSESEAKLTNLPLEEVQNSPTTFLITKKVYEVPVFGAIFGPLKFSWQFSKFPDKDLNKVLIARLISAKNAQDLFPRAISVEKEEDKKDWHWWGYILGLREGEMTQKNAQEAYDDLLIQWKNVQNKIKDNEQLKKKAEEVKELLEQAYKLAQQARPG